MSQTRTFAYTGSDLTTETTPESGTVTYAYDNVHNVTTKTDNIGQQTVYSRDVYYRVTEVQHYVWQSGVLVEDLTQRVNYTSPAPAMSVSYYASNNQQMGLSYDGNGNQTWDSTGVTHYTWNVENRLATSQGSGTTTWYSYDDRGRRVMKDTNSTPGTYRAGDWEFPFYGIDGQRMAILGCSFASYLGGYSCALQLDIHFGKKLLQSRGTPVVTNRLGTVRWNLSNWGMSYYPWGEERTSTSDDMDKFGTYYRDAPGQDYARARYYGSDAGRFWSPDPGGIRTANPRNPTSWNRYAYANGDPVNFNDPHGKWACFVEEDPDCQADPDPDPDPDPSGGSGSAEQGSDPTCSADTCVNVSATVDPTATYEPATIGLNGVYTFSTTVYSLTITSTTGATTNTTPGPPSLFAMPASGPGGWKLSPGQQYQPPRSGPTRIRPPQLRPVNEPPPVLAPDPTNDPTSTQVLLFLIMDSLKHTLDTVVLPPVVMTPGQQRKLNGGGDSEWH